MAEKSISLPFTIDSYGNVASTTSQSKIWADRVRSVIGTAVRERVMRPSFGTLIPYALFETSTLASEEIQAEVEKAFSSQLTILTLQNTEVSYDEYSGTVSVTITYDLPNNEQVTTTVGLILVQGTTPSYKELL